MAPNETVWDLGANVGYYTLIAARRAVAGRVVAFEPLPSNVAGLTYHLMLNNISNVQVVEAAVSNHEGEAPFEESADNSTGRLAAAGTLRVRLLALDAMLSRGEVPVPTLIKMDIEGAEYDALYGATELLARHRPTVFLATHGESVHRACSQLLTQLKYTLFPLNDTRLESCSELVAQPKPK